MLSIPTMTVLGGGLGALYGLGDDHHNPLNEISSPSTGGRALQGAAAGLGGSSVYKALRSSGSGLGRSGLLGLLSAGAIAALTNPDLEKSYLDRLPFTNNV